MKWLRQTLNDRPFGIAVAVFIFVALGSTSFTFSMAWLLTENVFSPHRPTLAYQPSDIFRIFVWVSMLLGGTLLVLAARGLWMYKKWAYYVLYAPVVLIVTIGAFGAIVGDALSEVWVALVVFIPLLLYMKLPSIKALYFGRKT